MVISNITEKTAYTKQNLCGGGVHETETKPNCGIIVKRDTIYPTYVAIPWLPISIYNPYMTYYSVMLQKSTIWGAANEYESISSLGTFAISNITPMPITDIASFRINVLENGNLNVFLFDLAGSKIMDIITEEYLPDNTIKEIPLNLSFLPKGAYTIIVQVKNDKIAKQIIIN